MDSLKKDGDMVTTVKGEGKQTRNVLPGERYHHIYREAIEEREERGGKKMMQSSLNLCLRVLMSLGLEGTSCECSKR